MTVAQKLRMGFTQWLRIHVAVHGTLTPQELEIAQEVSSFLITCAQASEVGAEQMALEIEG